MDSLRCGMSVCVCVGGGLKCGLRGDYMETAYTHRIGAVYGNWKLEDFRQFDVYLGCPLDPCISRGGLVGWACVSRPWALIGAIISTYYGVMHRQFIISFGEFAGLLCSCRPYRLAQPRSKSLYDYIFFICS